MMKRNKLRRVPNPDKIVYPVRVSAVKASFVETPGMMHRIQVQFEDAKGDVTQIDLEVKEAVTLIEEMVAAYHAIVPVLKTSRGGIGL